MLAPVKRLIPRTVRTSIRSSILSAVTTQANPVEQGMIDIRPDGFWAKRQKPTASLHRAARLFDEHGGKTIVEVGTGLHGDGAGNSVVIWAEQTRAERIFAVDLDPKQIADIQPVAQVHLRVKPVVMDGLKFIEDFRGTIDLLYLDFWIPDPAGELRGMGRALAYKQAYKHARVKLGRTSLILIDDTDHVNPWKHTHIVMDAQRDGFRVVWTGRQTCLFRRDGGLV